MKILVAINATKPKGLGDNVLRWVGRLGQDKAIFIPKNKRSKFMAEIDDANYHYYLDLKYTMLVGRTTAKEYAKQHEYDLLLTIPEDLKEWRKGTAFKPTEIAHVVKAIGKARIAFGNDVTKNYQVWANGAMMERV